jgi:hypothetical protein
MSKRRQDTRLVYCYCTASCTQRVTEKTRANHHKRQQELGDASEVDNSTSSSEEEDSRYNRGLGSNTGQPIPGPSQIPRITSNRGSSAGVDDHDVEMTNEVEAETIQVEDLMDIQGEDTPGMDSAGIEMNQVRKSFCSQISGLL